jgi:hypothetical protein
MRELRGLNTKSLSGHNEGNMACVFAGKESEAWKVGAGGTATYGAQGGHRRMKMRHPRHRD